MCILERITKKARKWSERGQRRVSREDRESQGRTDGVYLASRRQTLTFIPSQTEKRQDVFDLGKHMF